jgi:iron complex transport system ATP-binding protein
MIEVINLSFSYDQKNILKNLEFTLNGGELTCLLGANGSGKTTIIKCLNGILSPDKGQIILDEVSVSEMNQKKVARQVSMVPQEHTSIFSYKSIDVVTMGVTPYLKFGHQPHAKDYHQARSIMDNLNISHLADRNYNKLSGGERQLVLICRALMQRADYMLLDEPSSHLDFKNQHLIMRELKELTRGKTGIVTALHDPNLALKYCDRVIIIKEGEILARGETDSVMTDENLSRAYETKINVQELGRRVEIIENLDEIEGVI